MGRYAEFARKIVGYNRSVPEYTEQFVTAIRLMAKETEGFDEKNKPYGESALHKKVAVKKLAALESALRLALAAREGFVMVPVEPTPDMLEAGAGTKYEKRARNVWRDMIAAAAPKGTT